MILANVKQNLLNLGRFTRKDNEQFDITGCLFESPDEYNYWPAVYDAHHQQWGHMRFSLLIPKKIAPSVEAALLIIQGLAFDQVKSELMKADKNGRPFTMAVTLDGCYLL